MCVCVCVQATVIIAFGNLISAGNGKASAKAQGERDARERIVCGKNEANTGNATATEFIGQ